MDESIVSRLPEDWYILPPFPAMFPEKEEEETQTVEFESSSKAPPRLNAELRINEEFVIMQLELD